MHKRFTVEQIQAARLRYPGVHMIVHPECTMEVVDAADEAGSTDLIRKKIESAPPGSIFTVGTEINMVQRLANEHPDKPIFCLDSIICPCSTMYRIPPSYLTWVRESLERVEILNRITVFDRDCCTCTHRSRTNAKPCAQFHREGGAMTHHKHIIIVGCGIASLIAAIELSAAHEVTLFTKLELAEGNTRWTQGGVAAVMFPDDSVTSHIADTLRAGAGLCRPEAVNALCTEGPARIRDLIRLGVSFDQRDGKFARGLEAAHSHPRVLHANGDATDLSIEMALVHAVRSSNVKVLENTFVCDLLMKNDHVNGLKIIEADGKRSQIEADAVILASGGGGQIYLNTTNPICTTGDGTAMALRAGAQIADAEFSVPPNSTCNSGNLSDLRGRAQ